MDAHTVHYAVVFFDGNTLVKEMLFSEFEAVLDNVVGLPQFENRTAQAVFVKINAQLQVIACVFFLIRFGEGGRADPAWNMPLPQLSESAGKGPDLGAGPIRLACQSQCPAAWHRQSLWDPLLDGPQNHLEQLRQAAQRNRLALLSVDLPASQAVVVPTLGAGTSVNADALRLQIQQQERERAEGAIKQAKLQLATQATQHQQALDDLHRQYLRDMRDDHETLRQLKEKLAQSQARAKSLEAELQTRIEAMAAARESQLAEAAGQEMVSARELEALQQRFQVELEARLEAASRSLRENLETREVELIYRDEQIAILHEEVAALHQDKQRLLRDGAGSLLDKLEQSGISFVAWSPALGHINVPLVEMGRFLDAPNAYFAERSDVPADLYDAWFEHHSFPVCQHALDDGGLCGEPLERTASPVQFLSGRSDRCSQHQAHGR